MNYSVTPSVSYISCHFWLLAWQRACFDFAEMNIIQKEHLIDFDRIYDCLLAGGDMDNDTRMVAVLTKPREMNTELMRQMVGNFTSEGRLLLC